MNILGIMVTSIFIIIWTVFTKKMLPQEINEGVNNKIDERETRILLEVFSNTFVTLVYVMLLALILKLSGLANFDRMKLANYPEIMYLGITIGFFIFHYLYIKSKYSVKG